MAAIIDKGKCTGCGSCVDVCPVEAVKVDQEEKLAVVHDEECLECGACVSECPSEAISLPE